MPELKLEISVELTKEEYIKAALFTSRRTGLLRSTPFIWIAALFLLVIGLFSFNWFLYNLLVPIVICLFCLLLLFLFFLIEPRDVRKKAGKDYETYHTLMEPASISFFSDNVVTKSPHITLNDQYALLVECIETPEMFIFIKDTERQLILPKRCIPPEKTDAALEFIRQVFIRKRRTMRSWLF